MKDGVLEQIGTPREVYNAPASKFVAGFIGSPAMNFAPAAPVPGRRAVRAFGADIPLPNGCGMEGEGFAEIGIRPEHLRIDADHGAIELAVDVIENLGIDTIVYGRTMNGGNEPVVVRMEGDHDFAPGQRFFVSVSSRRRYISSTPRPGGEFDEHRKAARGVAGERQGTNVRHRDYWRRHQRVRRRARCCRARLQGVSGGER